MWQKIFFSLILLFSVLISSCSDDKNTLKVGTISGPETDLIATAKQVAKDKYNLNVKIVSFGDYSLPNTALADGSIDINIFQHYPYLAATNKARGYNLVSVGKTFIYPMGIYSKRHKNLTDLPVGATIAIPNDPTNEARALYLLEKAGLIKLSNSNSTYFITENDISKNPKNLKIKSLNAAQLPRVLQDVDAALINTNYAVPAGLSPSKDALYSENKDSAYANIIAVRENDKNNAQILQFVNAVQSPEVAEKAHQLFGETAIAVWEK